MFDFFPPNLLVKDKINEVILLLQQLPVPPRRKKEALAWWGNFVGAAITEEMYHKLLGDQINQV